MNRIQAVGDIERLSTTGCGMSALEKEMRALTLAMSRTSLGLLIMTLAVSSSGARLWGQRVLGLDISAWQGNISQTTWNNIRNVENRQFVIFRSSRGGTTGFYNQNNPNNNNPPGQNTLSQRYDDPYFVQNINRSTTAGIYAGSYHFSRPDIIASTLNSGGIPNSGTDEANHFMQMSGAWMRPGYLLPVHDLEAGDGIRTDNEMAQFSIDFSNRIYDVMGIRPTIYTNGNYAQNVLGGASASLRNQVVASYPTLWSARWPNQANPNSINVQNAHPKDTYTNIYGPWDDAGVTHPWHFWQYASTGRLQSFNNGNSNLDFDVTQGDIEFLKDQLVPALWMNDNSSDWATLSNWNSGQVPVAPVTGPGQVSPVGVQTLPTPRLPGAAGNGVTSGQHDTVILNRPNTNITVTHSVGTHSVRKLFVRESLNITGGLLAVNYDPTYPSDTVNFPNALRSGPISAQFSENVSLSGSGAFSVHTLQVDAATSFTLDGGSLTFKQVNLVPDGSTPAQIAVSGDVVLNPLNNAAASIDNGTGSGNTGFIDLGAANRMFDVGDGSAPIDVTINVPISNGGVTKAGLGTLSLAVANTYVGDTSVQSGTLSIDNPFLANGSDVYLSSGSILNLNFTGTPDIIDSLLIDNIMQFTGIWGAIGSGAQFTSPLITGSGRLLVTTGLRSGDFDNDGDFDCADIDGLVAEIAAGTNSVAFDLTGDGVVNLTDLDEWRIQGGAANLSSGNPYLVGDADLDGTVDGLDFIVWNGNKFTSSAAWCSGDFNADGVIDGQDFISWNTNKFTSADSAGAIPEPTSASFVLVATMFVAVSRTRRL